jgi:uncharacterized membrane protein
MDALRAVVLIAATMSMGSITGAFFLYAHTIMPGLKRVDDRTFVGAFQAIDRAIVSPLFLITSFVGALVLTAAAGLLFISESKSVLGWIIAAFLLYLPAVVMTGTINVPRNDAIKAAGEPHEIADLAAVRKDFNEAVWSRWNNVRTVLCMASFACLSAALLLA